MLLSACTFTTFTYLSCTKHPCSASANEGAAGSRQAAGAMSGAGWTEEAMKALLSISEEGNIQLQLDRVKSNKSDLLELGYEFTSKQCRTKVKNLTQSCRKVRGSKST